MMILRLLMIGLIAWFIFRFVQRMLANQTSQQMPPPAPPGQQAMRRCAYCQVHIPEGESTQSRGEFFCSEAHRDSYFREKR